MSKSTLLLQQTLKPLAGGILGLLLGSAVGLPIAKAFAPATVTWNTSACSAGSATLTATARHLDTGNTYRVTSNVVLPVPSVVQTFSDLPAGPYEVEGVLKRGSTTLGTETQALTVFDWPSPVTPTPAPGLSPKSGSRSAPKPPSTARKGRNTPAPVSGGSDRIAPPSDGGTRIRTRGSLQAAIQARLDEITQAIGDDRTIRTIEVADVDEDGRVDVVRIEWVNGDVSVWEIWR